MCAALCGVDERNGARGCAARAAACSWRDASEGRGRTAEAEKRAHAWLPALLLGGDLGAVDPGLKQAMLPAKRRTARARRMTPTMADDREGVLQIADGYLLRLEKRRLGVLRQQGVPQIWRTLSPQYYKRLKIASARGNRVDLNMGGAAAGPTAAAAVGATMARFLGRT